jgi:hypothetical protein
MDRWSQFLEEQDEEIEEQFHSKSCILFVLDITIPETLKILKHIIEFMDYSIKNNSDKIGILLLGTKESKNINGFENMFTLLDLQEPDIVKIKELQDFKIESVKEYSIRDCFHECQVLFKKAYF